MATPTKRPWSVHKFGGTSLADADCFRNVADLLLEREAGPLGVVVSAKAGDTDGLLRCIAMAGAGDAAWSAAFDALVERHATTGRALLDPPPLERELEALTRDADALRPALGAACAAAHVPAAVRDLVVGHGEIWSARLLAAFLAQRDPRRGGLWLDARSFLTVRASELGPTVLWERSRAALDALVPPGFEGIAVVTGFIAVDEEGTPTTLGRNGSDYSAAIVAALRDATELTIWTDVDGVMSADPRRVPEAHVLEALSYDEAMELAYFGAKVIHPQTLGPLVARDVPVLVRNTRVPALPGTRVDRLGARGGEVKGVTAVDDLALLNLEGSGMIGVPGTAQRLFAALGQAGVSVILISQGSSEHSLCVAVPERLAARARDAVREAFADALAGGQIQSVEVTPGQSIVAVVGDGMAGVPGIASRFFAALGRTGINVRAIAQGSSERNISAVVASADATRALRAVHSGFTLSAKTLSIGLIGPGHVGGALLDQLERRAERLTAEFRLDLRVRAVARSGRMVLADPALPLAGWREALDAAEAPFDLAAFERHVHAEHLPHAVILDCTASAAVAAHYPRWLDRGIHVITPNKKAFSADSAAFRRLARSARGGGGHCLYETTVGAALPILGTLRDLIATGDEVRSVQGILSGTLAYLFNVYDGSVPFSDIVREARAAGYTEPDPRDDLSGLDVARKLTILARELGWDLDVGRFPVESLVPEPLRDVDLASFLDRLSEHDAAMEARYRAAASGGRKLRYVARLGADGEARVGLEAVAPDHPFARIQRTDNVVQFESARYAANPLVIQGPGAGPELTAAGVFADLLRLAQHLAGA